jgi:hypothetical protein
MLVGGGAATGAGIYMHSAHVGPLWLAAALLGVGGLFVVFGSCGAMIKAVEGIAARMKWNEFVAGTMAGLASNLPEVVMLGFVAAKEPRVGFIVVALTLHVGAMTFGVYSGLLPRDESGHARLPEPLVKLSTDLYACAAAVFLATGFLMLSFVAFAHTKDEAKIGLTAPDLYVIGTLLLAVQVVAVIRLVKRFSGDEDVVEEEDRIEGEPEEEIPGSSWGAIFTYGGIGVVTTVIGGHAVGDFASILVGGLTARGYSPMLGALILSVFAASGALAMIATAHTKGMYDIAIANVSGQISQVPFLVMPILLIQIAAFSQLGIIPTMPGGGVLPIDLETTAVMLLTFPPLLLLWKAVSDDGYVNWIETATLTAVFTLTLYFLVRS